MTNEYNFKIYDIIIWNIDLPLAVKIVQHRNTSTILLQRFVTSFVKLIFVDIFSTIFSTTANIVR